MGLLLSNSLFLGLNLPPGLLDLLLPGLYDGVLGCRGLPSGDLLPGLSTRPGLAPDWFLGLGVLFPCRAGGGDLLLGLGVRLPRRPATGDLPGLTALAGLGAFVGGLGVLCSLTPTGDRGPGLACFLIGLGDLLPTFRDTGDFDSGVTLD